MLFQYEVTDCEHEWMTRVDELSESKSRPVEWADGFFSKTDALVTFQYRSEFAAVATSYLAVAFAYKSRNVSDLEAGLFPWVHCTAYFL